MTAHDHPVAAAVEAAITSMNERTWTALRRRSVADRPPAAVTRGHRRLTADHPDAYLPAAVYRYCCLIAANTPDRATPCAHHSLITVCAATAGKRQLANLFDATGPVQATDNAISILRRLHTPTGLCVARLWLDLCGLTASQTPRGPAGRTGADRVRHRWRLDAHAIRKDFDRDQLT